MLPFRTIARTTDIPLGRALQLRVGDKDIAILKVGEEFHVLDAYCPHKGGPLAAGWIENGSVFCPLHGWEFDLRTGACKTNPEKPVTCYPVRVVGNEIQVQI